MGRVGFVQGQRGCAVGHEQHRMGQARGGAQFAGDGHSITGAASLGPAAALSNLGRRNSSTNGIAIRLRIIMSLKSLLKEIMAACRVIMLFSMARSCMLDRSAPMGE